MKKTYIQPAQRVAEMETETLIANSQEPQSITFGGLDEGHGVAETKEERSSIWDDNEW